MRPSWCPHPDCIWKTGGGATVDSGMACGGELPTPQAHDTGMNTHRICIKPFDSAPFDLQVNKTDLWYLDRIITAMRKLICQTTGNS